MMRINYYQFADCTRFRIPSVDLTSVDKDLKAILLQSFDQGISADYALEQALNNQDLVQNLASQVAENLQFQQQNALERVNTEVQTAASGYQEEQTGKIQRIDAYLTPIIDQKKGQYQHQQQKVAEKKEFYSAAQRSLEEMRARVQQRLAEVGGLEGYKKIEQIGDSLQQGKYSPASAAPYTSTTATNLTAPTTAISSASIP